MNRDNLMPTHSYFNFSNNKIMFDERNKRFIYLKNANKHHRRLFNKSSFAYLRPDYFGEDQRSFMEDLKNGQSYLRAMMNVNRHELKRMYRILGGNAFMHVEPIMDDFLKQLRVDSLRLDRLWTWRDSTLMVEYFREHQRRAEKYGLDNGKGLLDTSKEALKQREDELVDYFLHEMRKKPVK